MEATILYRGVYGGCIGIMENNTETATLYRGYLGITQHPFLFAYGQQCDHCLPRTWRHACHGSCVPAGEAPASPTTFRSSMLDFTAANTHAILCCLSPKHTPQGPIEANAQKFSGYCSPNMTREPINWVSVFLGKVKVLFGRYHRLRDAVHRSGNQETWA